MFAPSPSVPQCLCGEYEASPRPASIVSRESSARSFDARSYSPPRHRGTEGHGDFLFRGCDRIYLTQSLTEEQRAAGREWLPDAMARATTIKTAATANVTRIPAATPSGCAVMMLVVPDPRANTVPITEAPVISPRLRDRLRMPEMTPPRSSRIQFTVIPKGRMPQQTGKA